MKKTKFIKTILLVLIFAQVTLLCSQTTQAKIYKVSVTKYAQEKKLWCWAACAQMLGKYYYKNMSQTTICKKTMKKVVNKTANAGEMVVALQHATNRHAFWTGKKKIDILANELKAKRPFAITVQWKDKKESHLYVVSGVRINEKGKSDAVYMIDPAPGISNQYVKYKKLVNGVTFKHGTGKYVYSYFLTNHDKNW